MSRSALSKDPNVERLPHAGLTRGTANNRDSLTVASRSRSIQEAPSMLKRLALALALISGSVQAEGIEPQDRSEREDSESVSELRLRSDGTIVSWGLLRLVLPDLEDGSGDPEWIQTPVHAWQPDNLSLDTLGGRTVTGPRGEAIGIVRGCLVSPSAGRVLALDVDVGPSLHGESRRVALPWALVTVAGGDIRCVCDPDWIHAAESIFE